MCPPPGLTQIAAPGPASSAGRTTSSIHAQRLPSASSSPAVKPKSASPAVSSQACRAALPCAAARLLPTPASAMPANHSRLAASKGAGPDAATVATTLTQNCGAGQRMRAATGVPDNGEPIDSESVRRGGSIGRHRGDGAVRIWRRSTVTGSIAGEPPQPEPPCHIEQRWRGRPDIGGAVVPAHGHCLDVPTRVVHVQGPPVGQGHVRLRGHEPKIWCPAATAWSAREPAPGTCQGSCRASISCRSFVVVAQLRMVMLR